VAPVGLSAALLLARQGVESLLVERHATSSHLPKARLVNTTHDGGFRQCGVESEVRAAGLPPSKARYLIRARSVTGEELDRRSSRNSFTRYPGHPGDPDGLLANMRRLDNWRGAPGIQRLGVNNCLFRRQALLSAPGQEPRVVAQGTEG
jgi:flavin-dependent dehydrogenase